MKRRGRTRSDPDTDPKIEVKVENWAALAGQWRLSGAQATFVGPGDKDARLPLGLTIGEQAFRDGVIRTRFKLSRLTNTAGGIVVGYQSLTAPYVIAQVGGYDRAYSIAEFRPGLGWVSLTDAGLLTNLDVNAEHDLRVEVYGQSVSMEVNRVPVLTAVLRQPLAGTGMGLFAWGDAEVAFQETYILGSPPTIFVMMPFAEPFDTLYRDVIRPTAKDLGFRLLRVDEIRAPGMILDDIQRQIAASHAVVAEISTQNPNVFYELGYAHALRKPAILLVRRSDSTDMPFDIRGYRAILYDDSIGGKKSVEATLRAHLQAVKRSRYGESDGAG